jgi:hypothetical protein
MQKESEKELIYEYRHCREWHHFFEVGIYRIERERVKQGGVKRHRKKENCPPRINLRPKESKRKKNSCPSICIILQDEKKKYRDFQKIVVHSRRRERKVANF